MGWSKYCDVSNSIITTIMTLKTLFKFIAFKLKYNWRIKALLWKKSSDELGAFMFKMLLINFTESFKCLKALKSF